jgi:hypothetical protein
MEPVGGELYLEDSHLDVYLESCLAQVLKPVYTSCHVRRLFHLA